MASRAKNEALSQPKKQWWKKVVEKQEQDQFKHTFYQNK